MKKLRSKAGVTLIEMLTAVLVLVLLVVGMDATMDLASKAYTQSIFQSNSAALAGILNTAMGDILRYSEDVYTDADFPEGTENPLSGTGAPFVFTNYEYGVKDGYFYPEELNDGSNRFILEIRNLRDEPSLSLVNSGAYPRLKVSEFEISYHAADSTQEPSYFAISYRITDIRSEDMTREVSHTVRRLNPDV